MQGNKPSKPPTAQKPDRGSLYGNFKPRSQPAQCAPPPPPSAPPPPDEPLDLPTYLAPSALSAPPVYENQRKQTTGARKEDAPPPIPPRQSLIRTPWSASQGSSSFNVTAGVQQQSGNDEEDYDSDLELAEEEGRVYETIEDVDTSLQSLHIGKSGKGRPGQRPTSVDSGFASTASGRSRGSARRSVSSLSAPGGAGARGTGGPRTLDPPPRRRSASMTCAPDVKPDVTPPWLFLHADRAEAEKLLKSSQDGTFLVRPSQKFAFTLSCQYGGKVEHIPVHKKNNCLSLSTHEKWFPTLKALVDHYMEQLVQPQEPEAGGSAGALLRGWPNKQPEEQEYYGVFMPVTVDEFDEFE